LHKLPFSEVHHELFNSLMHNQYFNSRNFQGLKYLSLQGDTPWSLRKDLDPLSTINGVDEVTLEKVFPSSSLRGKRVSISLISAGVGGYVQTIEFALIQ